MIKSLIIQDISVLTYSTVQYKYQVPFVSDETIRKAKLQIPVNDYHVYSMIL